MNKFSAVTTALVTTLGAAFSAGVIPNKYAGYALIAATFVQAFQGAINKPKVSDSAPSVPTTVTNG